MFFLQKTYLLEFIFVYLEIPVKPCEPNPCLHAGVCVEDGEDFICRCPIDFIGSTCEIGWLTNIRKACPCKIYTLKPHFYIEKNWGMQGYTYFSCFRSKQRL